MPGSPTELTSRLEVSRRQFFQWHLVEKRQIPEVKAKMDELTRVLQLAGYDYNFIAEEKSWKSRSRHWNKSAKAAWKVELHQKGRDLPIPMEISNVPIWIEWDQDVGEWRKSRSKESHLSHSSVAQIDEHQEPYQNTGHCDAQTQNPRVTQASNGFNSSHALPVPSPSALRYPHTLNPTKGICTTRHPLDTGPTAWSPRNAAPFTSIHPPMIPLPEQTRNTQHQHLESSNIWYPKYPTATSAPTTTSMPSPDTAYRKDDYSAPSIAGIELSHTTSQTQSASLSVSNLPHYTYQGQNGYQNGYAPPSSSLGSHHPQQSADLAAIQSTQSQGSPWTVNQWDSPQYGSGSSQGQNGA